MSNEKMILTEREKDYLNELAADIASHSGLGGTDIESSIKEAHLRRQDFAQEMALGMSNRSKQARKVIGAHIYACQVINTAMRHLNAEQEDIYRRGILANL